MPRLACGQHRAHAYSCQCQTQPAGRRSAGRRTLHRIECSYQPVMKTKTSLLASVCSGAPFSFQSGINSSSAWYGRGKQRISQFHKPQACIPFNTLVSKTLPDNMWRPTSAPFSTTHTLKSLPDSAHCCLIRMAAARPAGPALRLSAECQCPAKSTPRAPTRAHKAYPTMTTSYSMASRGSASPHKLRVCCGTTPGARQTPAVLQPITPDVIWLAGPERIARGASASSCPAPEHGP